MQELPLEILEEIFSHLSLKDYITAMSCCKTFRYYFKNSKHHLKKVMKLNMKLCKVYSIADTHDEDMSRELHKNPGKRMYAVIRTRRHSIQFKRFCVGRQSFYFGWGLNGKLMVSKLIPLENHTKSSRVKDGLLVIRVSKLLELALGDTYVYPRRTSPVSRRMFL